MAESVSQNVFETISKPTVHDVARLAKVSISTVSASFNDGPVNEKTRLRVLEAARKLGYRPNLIARSMITKKTHVLGMILPWNNVEITDASVTAALSNNYDLIVSFSSNNAKGGERHCIERLIERRVDGIIFLPQQNPFEDYSQILSVIRMSGIKVVLIDKYFNEIKADAIVTDNIKGGMLATEYLLKLGHRKILFLADSEKSSCGAERLEGYMLAFSKAGIVVDRDMIVYVSKGENAKSTTKKILTSSKDITAIFATGDHLAYDVMLACKEIGRKIPDDVSLVGFDDMLLGPHRIGEILNPPLTTIRQDFTSMVQQAVELLVSKIKDDFPEKGEIKYIKPELIVRESARKIEDC